MFRKLKMGLIGGGEGSFMGGIHQMAARLDGLIDCVAGALSSNSEKAQRSGLQIGLAPDRIYNSFDDLIKVEQKRKDRIDFVSIVTPNNQHFAPAKLALESGFDVIVEKPLCFSLTEARELRRLVHSSGKLLAITHTYAAYPAVIEAQALVASGRLGKLKKVVVQYPQGWLSTKIEDSQQKQAAWRTDPKQAGPSCCFADIGTHALNLAETICGQNVVEVLAEIQTFVPGRSLDDDATLLLRFDGGLRGCALVSQISTGENNAINISVYGELGGLHWTQAKPNQLKILWPEKPNEIILMGIEKLYLHENTRANLRTPSGHPEGYLEAFANIYKNFALTLIARDEQKPQPPGTKFPDVETGFHGMALIEAVIESSKNGSVWTKVEAN